MSDDTIPLFNIANGRDDLETWLPVEGYEGLYEVSDHGRVKHLARKQTLSNGRVLQYREVMVKGWIGPFGHRSIHLRKPGASPKKWYVHRLVAYTFIGPPASEDLEICHSDGNAGNNHASNLRWDTHSANQKDQVAHGTHANASRTHCRRGHLLSGFNLGKNGASWHRSCVTCSKTADYLRVRGIPISEAEPYYEEIYRRVMSGVRLRKEKVYRARNS